MDGGYDAQYGGGIKPPSHVHAPASNSIPFEQQGSFSCASTHEYNAGQRQSRGVSEPTNHFDCSYEPVPSRPLSIRNMPSRFVKDGVPYESTMTAENLDVQYKKEREEFERRASVYRHHQEQPYHHTQVAGTPTLWEQGYIVDKGRRAFKPPHESSLVLSHDTDSWERPQSAPATPQATAVPAWRADKALQQQRGQYNPLTHEYLSPVDPSYQAERNKDFNRQSGLSTKGQGYRNQAWASASLNLDWDAVNTAHRPLTAPSMEMPGTLGHQGGYGASSRTPPPSPGLSGGAGRARHMSGSSWGTYDPISHAWKTPPADPKYENQNSVVDKQSGVSGSSLGRVPGSASHGVYNPITGTWTTPPCDPREARGLSFAPATMFSKPTPSTIRL